MALPTQADFLANALEPVEHDDCSICHAPMTSPARLPCKHMFCRNCITEWLTQPQVDSCPMCRRRLFQPVVGVLSEEDETELELQLNFEAELAAGRLEFAEMEAESERMRIELVELRARSAVARAEAERDRVATRRVRWVRDAFTAAGLVHVLWRDTQTDFRSSDVLDLNAYIRWSEERLDQFRHDAQSMLINNDLPRLPQGAVQIDAESLGTSLILMSNALMHIARKRSRPWSRANRGTWRQMVINTWQLISPEHGRLLDRQSLYLAIMSGVIDPQCTNGDEQDHTPPMFFRQADLVRDLRFMVNFVVDHAGPTMSSDKVQEELAAHRIDGPLVFTSTVSPRADLLAAAHTSMTFVHA